jgi:hypothetical protein
LGAGVAFVEADFVLAAFFALRPAVFFFAFCFEDFFDAGFAAESALALASGFAGADFADAIMGLERSARPASEARI